jgi:uncharacterized protein YcbK (DUF882 family)
MGSVFGAFRAIFRPAMWSGIGWTVAAAASASLAAASVSSPLEVDPRVSHASGLACKKGPTFPEPPALLGTLVDVHTGTHLPLDATNPGAARFDLLLADRVTGATEALDARLLGLLRALAMQHLGARIELVSGYRSFKQNEMLRKKGHHVATHSQHSLGRALDFRVILSGESGAMDPLVLEQEIRGKGWDGGTGVYLGADDRFVHADVGPRRRWNGL